MGDEKLTWLLELNAKLDGAIKMTRELRETEKQISLADRALHKLEKGFESAFDKIKDWGKETAKFAMGQVLADSFEGALEKVAEFGREVYEAGEETIKLDRAFGYFLDNQPKDEHFEWLEKVAQKVPGTTEDLKRMQIGLLELGMPLKTVNDAMLGALDVGVMSGAKDPVARSQAAAAAIAGIYRTGRISRGTLAELGLTGEKAFDALAKSMGKSTTEVKKLLAQGGHIDKLQAINSVLVAIQEKEGGGLGKAAMAGGADLSERLRDLKDDIEEPFKHAFMEIEPELGDLVASIGKSFRESGLGDDLKVLFKDVVNTIKGIDWAGGARTLVEVLQVALHLARDIAKTVGFAAKVGDFIANPGLALARTIGEHVSSTPKSIGPVMSTGQAPEDLTGIMSRKDAGAARDVGMSIDGMSSGIGRGTPAPSSYMNPSPARGPVNVEVHVPISVHGGGPNTAKEVGDHLQKTLPSTLQGAAQRLAIEQGV